MTLVSRLRANRARARTDLQSTASSSASAPATPRRLRPAPSPPSPSPPPLPPPPPPVGSGRVPVVSMDDLSSRVLSRPRHHPPPLPPPPDPAAFFDPATEAEWVLRGGRRARQAAAAARAASRLEEAVAAAAAAPPPQPPSARARAPRRARGDSDIGLPRRVLSGVGAAAHRDRRVQFRRGARRTSAADALPGPASDGAPSERTISSHAYYDTEVDHHWRLPIGKPLRRADLLPDDADAGPAADDGRYTRWSIGTASETDVRSLRANAFQADRSDRRGLPSAWRADDGAAGRPRDRAGNRIGNGGARWRGLMARKDLVDGKADAYVYAVESGGEPELSPRSSLDIEEATSFTDWDEPPSTSVRGWRSNHSLSYRPRPNDRPRHIRVIGRQKCINDLTDIVDASNEPCVSYDRQIFDPVSKLWTYVEASQPSSSPWELRTVGSPVTCSVSGTEEAVSSAGGPRAPASAQSTLDNVSHPPSATVSVPPPPPPPPPLPEEDAQMQRSKSNSPPRRRNSSSPTRGFVAVPSAQEAQRMFKTTRDMWLGYTRQSVYGPANLEAVIFASEMEDVEEEARRRQSEDLRLASAS